MTRAACGHENPADATFCAECGTSPRTELCCDRCGHINPTGTKFCHGCGQRFADAGSAETGAPRARAAAPPLPSSFAGGRYQVRRFLGEGGKKRVYLAHDARLDRDVAIALIKTEGLDEAGRTRVRREAQAMGRLGSHAHIVTVHDILDEDGQPYIVQELMDGGALTDRIRSAGDVKAT